MNIYMSLNIQSINQSKLYYRLKVHF